MLQKLAGRLTWEECGAGIHVEIPARRDWFVIAATFVLAMIGFVSFCVAVLSFLFEPSGGMPWVSTICLLVLECLPLSVLIWNFKGKTTLTLDHAELKLVCHAFGVRWNARSFSIRSVRNLRFIPSSGFRISRYYIPGVICFEAEDKTRKFASGISDLEGLALIERMLEIYDFPKDRAIEYIGIRR